MITPEKINMFKKYKGYYDGYYIQNKDRPKVITDDEWFLLSSLIQDINMIRKGIVAKSYEVEIIKKIKENCDNDETVVMVFELEKYING